MASNGNSTPRVRWLVVLGTVAVVTIAVLYLRSGPNEPFPEAGSGAAGETRGETRQQEIARRRLQALRDRHEQAASSRMASSRRSDAGGAEGGKIDVPSDLGGESGVQHLKPRAGMSAQGETAAVPEADVDLDLDPDDIATLKQVALKDPDPDRRLTAVTLLGVSDNPEAISILGEALKDADEEVRLAAIQSLADMSDAAPVELLGTAALTDPSPDNRYEALEAVADLGGPAARSYLEKALQDPDEDVAALAESLLELESDSDMSEAAAPKQ